ncbi:hypothetical protein L1987_56494 [Smallanthus sonchifolius]|uniref:Uncharacterized protein n=1 Tax=Smallanthus sonchifolius TaxID=185202 RepID=A0ACB9EDZ2_9ASTR|nr:hypothetical protein L1987_56494 [Smallanthus sonchifolius]
MRLVHILKCVFLSAYFTNDLFLVSVSIIWNISQLMDNDRLKVAEKEGYVEAPGAEVFKSAIRKSSRLQSKKALSSCSKYVFKSYNRNSKGTKKSSKANLYKDNSISESKIQEEKKHQFPHRNEINGVFSANTTSMKSSTAVPSFQYHVQANEGISLVVDLNLKRSDWLKSMEKAVCVCQNHSKPAFESFRKEVECLGNRNNLKVSSPDKTSASDATMNSYVQNNFSIKSVSREDGNTLPSVVEKEVITESGSKQCWSKVDQNSDLLPESFENSEEVQLSDFSSQQKGSLCSRTGKTCSENLLNSSTEVIQEAGGNHSQSTVKKEERINSAEGMEVSGREENASVISASDDGPKRKKRNYKSDNIHGQSHERILRSTQIFGGKIIERDGVIIWRSSRLHTKAVRLLE